MTKGHTFATITWTEAASRLGISPQEVMSWRDKLGERRFSDGLTKDQFGHIADAIIEIGNQDRIDKLTRRNIELRNEVAYRVHPVKSMVTALIGVVIGGLIVWIAVKGGVV